MSKRKCAWCNKQEAMGSSYFERFCSKKCISEARAHDLRNKGSMREYNSAHDAGTCQYCGESGILARVSHKIKYGWWGIDDERQKEEFKAGNFRKIKQIGSYKTILIDDEEYKLLHRVDNKGVCWECVPKYNIDVERKNSNIMKEDAASHIRKGVKRLQICFWIIVFSFIGFGWNKNEDYLQFFLSLCIICFFIVIYTSIRLRKNLTYFPNKSLAQWFVEVFKSKK
ncbi:MAG: hypothetical protein CMD23_01095 [Flavobacteriales bacterium]|nr:hypothetical protein [Flavobacteriales bacterium]|tara:strand:+ start:171 stop:848 length:678 start_codon:yes stop_codon:yes gene_type:complete